jgi:oligosaccharyltransferase complex subunit alpha (ribophorin I)
VLTKLVFDLPQNAADVYYRDEVGNISTSHFRNEKYKSVLEIEPRFPLFGGWKTTWYMGYNVPLQQYGRYNKKKDEYILKVNFIENIKDNMSIDEMEFKVILPEGAT